ncbi:phage baseplate assembly protein V [Antarcticirhabdus aurantiaca]|uniref:Phage baseplate assembly protein V n=1 Tax=Antarcticirhabdus aurantiaca TaxID=2606717 RepID=A0ACD4NJ86_9HYPH|nr:phage baseplate assembly protein V [Antarcticirhabdus aurantiaca]WAJ26857.1 phage baseplate assembly protein V [Jeongeuplla avenae]
MLPEDLPGQVAWLVRQLAEMRRRERNRSREGTIVDARPADGLYRVRFRDPEGDAPAFDGPWMRVEALSSGTVKIQGEPVIGQSVTVRSESGDLTDGVIVLSSFSDANRRPHDKNGELKITVGEGFASLVSADGSEATKAKARVHETAGDVIFRSGGIVRFE